MKKSYFLAIFCSLILAACGGSKVTKPSSPVPGSKQTSSDSPKKGGYYLDDGPHANPPDNLDDIPNAIPKNEPLYKHSSKPYIALGEKYTPLKSAQSYKKRGVASWYGKLFHGKKTATGEVYDMYSMTAAHTVLPLPSYVKVTNVENGRSVIVRVNDRGPFKHEREIDLSYAAAYKLRLIEKGSGLVEVEAIDPDQYISLAQSEKSTPLANPSNEASATDTITPYATAEAVKMDEIDEPQLASVQNNTMEVATPQHYVQAGAFSDETNATTLQKKIQALAIEQVAKINRVYNNGLHRLMVGPYQTRQEAEQIANNIRNNLNISTIITIK